MVLNLQGIEVGITIQAMTNYKELVDEAIKKKVPDTGIISLDLAKQTTLSILEKLNEVMEGN